MADTYKFRIDHHGSLIRPPELLAARERHATGALDDAGLRAVEDSAIAEAVRYQRGLRLSVITDGDFRREDFRSAVFDAVSGFRRTADLDAHGRARWAAVEELRPAGPLVADQVAAIAELTQAAPAKATLPSPAYLALTCFEPGGAYASPAELGRALTQIIRDEIELLISRGIRLVQLDNPRYTGYLHGRGGQPLDLEEVIAIDAAAVDVAGTPEDVRIGICPAHRSAGPVDRVVAEKLFAEVPVDRWVLPYDKGTEGEADLLRAVPADRDACLGIVDPATSELEDVETIMQRLDLAAELRDIEDVAVSPSMGFSDAAGEAVITADDQRRKLIHVETIARMCWGNEL